MYALCKLIAFKCSLAQNTSHICISLRYITEWCCLMWISCEVWNVCKLASWVLHFFSLMGEVSFYYKHDGVLFFRHGLFSLISSRFLWYIHHFYFTSISYRFYKHKLPDHIYHTLSSKSSRIALWSFLNNPRSRWAPHGSARAAFVAKHNDKKFRKKLFQERRLRFHQTRK